MACPAAWSDATEEIVIGAADDEATVTAKGEADGGDEAIVAGESPVVDYVIVSGNCMMWSIT